MKVIAHQAIRMHLPVGLAASLPQRAQEPLAICVVLADILALVPAVHHVIHRPRILDAQLARHGQPLSARPGSVIWKDCLFLE